MLSTVPLHSHVSSKHWYSYNPSGFSWSPLQQFRRSIIIILFILWHPLLIITMSFFFLIWAVNSSSFFLLFYTFSYWWSLLFYHCKICFGTWMNIMNSNMIKQNTSFFLIWQKWCWCKDSSKTINASICRLQDIYFSNKQPGNDMIVSFVTKVLTSNFKTPLSAAIWCVSVY